MEEKARGRNGHGKAETGGAGQPDGRKQRHNIGYWGGARGEAAEPPMRPNGTV